MTDATAAIEALKAALSQSAIFRTEEVRLQLQAPDARALLRVALAVQEGKAAIICETCHGLGLWRGGGCPVCEGRGTEPHPFAGLTTVQRIDIERHIRGIIEDKETYPAPRHGWTCFLCGETFKTSEGARLHFGESVKGRPICEPQPLPVEEVERVARAICRVDESTFERPATDEDVDADWSSYVPHAEAVLAALSPKLSGSGDLCSPLAIRVREVLEEVCDSFTKASEHERPALLDGGMARLLDLFPIPTVRDALGEGE